MDFAFNSSQVFISLFSLITSIGLLIATWKYWLIRVSYKGHGNFGFKLNQRTKYGQYDVFTCRSILLQLGLLFSLASVVVIISWTSYDAREVKVPEIYEVIDLIEIEPPRTFSDPPKLNLPKLTSPPIVEVSELIESREKPVLIETSVEEPVNAAPSQKIVYQLSNNEIINTPPPRPKEPVFDLPEVFEIVEEMPRFPGCEDITGTVAEKKKCADEKLLDFLYRNLKYPSIARENNVAGRLYIRFIVEKDGSISNGEIIRDIGAGCGEAALNVIMKMDELTGKWTPGKQGHTPVRVKYTLPVTFRLNH